MLLDPKLSILFDLAEAGVSMRGLPGCLESAGWCFLVVEVGAGATPRHNGAGYA